MKAAAEPRAPRDATWVRLVPISFFLLYLNATVLLFAFGPWPWPVTEPATFYLFLVFAHASLALGCLTAWRRRPWVYSGVWPVKKIYTVCVVINLALLLPTSVLNTGNPIPDVIFGLTQPGEAYATSVGLRDEQQGLLGIVSYVRIFVGPFLYMLLPLTVVFWRSLGWQRFLGMFCTGFTVAMYIAMGTNRAIADTVLLLPWFVWVGHVSGRLDVNWRRAVMLGVSGVLLFGLFLAFFGATMSSREGSSVRYSFFAATGTVPDDDHPLVRYLPEEAKSAALGLSLYLTHGYYALYLSLNREFVPMYGVGHSVFLTRQVVRVTGDGDIERMSYPARIERDGWNATGLWSSIYPWMASDVSFPGAILVVFLIGMLFGLVWLDATRAANPFAVALLGIVLIMLFYFPANNQVLQSGEGTTAFWGTLALWLITRRREVANVHG